MSNHTGYLYALMDRDGNLIGKDDSSGGYPWTPETMQGVWISTENKMMRLYADQSFRKEGYRLVKVSFHVEIVPEEKPACPHPYANVIKASGSGKLFCRECGEYLSKEVVVEEKPACAHPWDKVMRGRTGNKCLSCGKVL